MLTEIGEMDTHDLMKKCGELFTAMVEAYGVPSEELTELLNMEKELSIRGIEP